MMMGLSGAQIDNVGVFSQMLLHGLHGLSGPQVTGT